MAGKRKPDFQGWATKNDLVCADGLVIKKNAFSKNDGKKVPLVYAHDHRDPSNIIGHAILKNLKEGVYAYCYLNNGKSANAIREAVSHSDVEALSIFADNLSREGRDVVDGCIKEVSVVMSGANPGAFIESALEHGMSVNDYEDEAIIFTGDPLYLSHADDKTGQNSKSKKNDEEEDESDDETIQDVLDTLTDKQKAAVGMLLQGLEDELSGEEEDEDEGGDGKMKHHNVFETEDGGVDETRYLMHSDMAEIKKNAKACGSFKTAFYDYINDNDITLSHGLDTTGMDVPSGVSPSHGIKGIDMLFPDGHLTDAQPIMIGRNTTWVDEVMNNASYTPFKRVKTLYADITEDEARAKGYIKGKMKKEEVFSILKRTTDPQTIYKKQKLDKDDIDDIEDWDVLPWVKAEMEVMFEEEKARAILIGDGRLADSDDKIKEDKIRPIAKDVALFNTKIDVATTVDETMDAEVMIDSITRGMKKYKGSGSPTLFTTEDVVTEMLLAKDKNGNRLYKTEAELAASLRVGKITTVDVMVGQKIDNKDLIGIAVNMVDYKIGGNKSKKDFFEDFDIDYNQKKFLLEQRMSGALVKPFSAVTFLATGGGE